VTFFVLMKADDVPLGNCRVRAMRHLQRPLMS
jgi:hypothetical protein